MKLLHIALFSLVLVSTVELTGAAKPRGARSGKHGNAGSRQQENTEEQVKAAEDQYQRLVNAFEREKREILDIVGEGHGNLHSVEEIEALIRELDEQRVALENAPYLEQLGELYRKVEGLAGADEGPLKAVGDLRAQFHQLPHLVQQHRDAFQEQRAHLNAGQMGAIQAEFEALSQEYSNEVGRFKEMLAQLEAENLQEIRKRHLERLHNLRQKAEAIGSQAQMKDAIESLRTKFNLFPGRVQVYIEAFVHRRGQKMAENLEVLTGEYNGLNEAYKSVEGQYRLTIQDEQGNFRVVNRKMLRQLKKQKTELEAQNGAYARALEELSAKVEALSFEDNSQADLAKSELLGSVQILSSQFNHLPNRVQNSIRIMEGRLSQNGE